jgi:WD40 repeat protein
MGPDNGSVVYSLTGCIAWNPVRELLASGAHLTDETVRIWDAAAGRNQLVLNGHKAYVTGVAWSRDGNRLASCDSEGAVWVWDLAFRGH